MGFRDSGFQRFGDFGIEGFQDLWILGSRDSGIWEFGDLGILGFGVSAILAMLGFRDSGICAFWDSGIPRFGVSAILGILGFRGPLGSSAAASPAIPGKRPDPSRDPSRSPRSSRGAGSRGAAPGSRRRSGSLPDPAAGGEGRAGSRQTLLGGGAGPGAALGAGSAVGRSENSRAAFPGLPALLGSPRIPGWAFLQPRRRPPTREAAPGPLRARAAPGPAGRAAGILRRGADGAGGEDVAGDRRGARGGILPVRIPRGRGDAPDPPCPHPGAA